jgi:putative ABC transport system permease protein
VTGLRVITRLAVRESRRRPWRSLLVVLLIALPTAAAVFTSTWLHSAVDTPEEEVAQRFGQGDLLVFPNRAGATETDRVRSLLERQPDWRFTSWNYGYGLAAASGGPGARLRVSLSDLPRGDPLTRGIIPLRGGREATTPTEAVASQDILDALGLHVGDQLTLVRPRRTVTITGTAGGSPSYGGRTLTGSGLIAKGGLEQPAFLVDLPAGVRPQTFLKEAGVFLETRSSALKSARSLRRDDTLYLYLFAGLGIAAFGLIVSSALAVGARRQLRALGLTGANGTSPRQAGTLLLLQGAVLGMIGAAVGVGAGVALSYLLRPLVEGYTNQLEGAVELQPRECLGIGLLAVLIAVAAAWLPARTASRTTVLQALDGRRPLSKLGRRVPFVGLAISALGCLVLGWIVANRSSNQDGDAVIAILGTVLVVAGLVVCSPYLVGLLEGVGSKTSGALRVATRNIARQRSRTGPTVAAIMAAAALAVAAATVALSVAQYDPPSSVPDKRDNWVGLQAYVQGPELAQLRFGCAQTAALNASLEEAVPGITNRCLDWTTSDFRFSAGVRSGYQTVTVAPQDLALIGAARYREALGAGKAVWIGRQRPPATILGIPESPGEVAVVRSRGMSSSPFDDYIGRTYLVSASTAARLRPIHRSQSTVVVGTSAEPLTAAQREALVRFESSDPGAQLSTASRDVYVSLNFDRGFPRPYDLRFLTYAVILPTALVLALLTALVGLALAAAETRDEQATLVAVGAGPGHRRRQNAWQALIVSGLGVFLAIPGGFIAAFVVLKANYSHRESQIDVTTPWLVITALGIGLPLLAAAGAALLTRSRMSPLIRRSV